MKRQLVKGDEEREIPGDKTKDRGIKTEKILMYIYLGISLMRKNRSVNYYKLTNNLNPGVFPG